jgi:hypothetical protein
MYLETPPSVYLVQNFKGAEMGLEAFAFEGTAVVQLASEYTVDVKLTVAAMWKRPAAMAA